MIEITIKMTVANWGQVKFVLFRPPWTVIYVGNDKLFIFTNIG